MSLIEMAPDDAAVPALAPWTADGVEVTSHRVIVRDGWYNAFTDLIQWKNFYWLSYRRGTFPRG